MQNIFIFFVYLLSYLNKHLSTLGLITLYLTMLHQYQHLKLFQHNLSKTQYVVCRTPTLLPTIKLNKNQEGTFALHL